MVQEANPTGQIQEFLRVLSRRRWQVLLPALFVLVLGSAFAVIVPKKYVVETTVEIRESRNPLDYDQKHRQESATAREIPNVSEHIINFKRVQNIVGRDLRELWPRYERGDRDLRGEMIKRIMRDIEVDVGEKTKSEGSTFIDLVYRDVEADRAQRFLERLTRLWIEEVIEFDESRLEDERDVLNEAVSAAREVYRVASERWVEQCREMGWNPADPPVQQGVGRPAGDFYFEQLTAYREQLAETTEALARGRSELKLLRESFEREPAMIRQVQVEPGKSYEAQRSKLMLDIGRLERERATITKHHHRYARLGEEIAEREQALAELAQLETADTELTSLVPNENKDALRLALEEKKREVAALADSLVRIQKNVATYEKRVERRGEEFGLLLSLWNDMDAASKEKSESEKALRDKEVSVRQAKRANIDVYAIVAPPLARDENREPSALLIVAFSLLAGLALGLSIALVTEYARDSYRTVPDLAAVLAVPVLGAIGTIRTGAELRRRFVRRLTVGGSSAVLLFGVAWVTFTWYSAPENLPLPFLDAIEAFQAMLM